MSILEKLLPNKKCILIVDDDKHILRLLELLTESDFRVVTASDSTVAEEMIAKGVTFDIYLFDVMIPKINGIELAKKIRTKSMKPIIFMSGKMLPGDLEELHNAVSNSHVFLKPFDCVKMLKWLKHLTAVEKS